MPDYQHTEQGKRLRKFREELGLSPKDMGESLGLAYTTYKDIESGRSNISATALRKLLNLYGLDANWLVNGEGPMLISDPVQQPKEESPVHALLPIIQASGEALVKVRTLEKVFVRLMARALNQEEEWVFEELRKELEKQREAIKAGLG